MAYALKRTMLLRLALRRNDNSHARPSRNARAAVDTAADTVRATLPRAAATIPDLLSDVPMVYGTVLACVEPKRRAT